MVRRWFDECHSHDCCNHGRRCHNLPMALRGSRTLTKETELLFFCPLHVFVFADKPPTSGYKEARRHKKHGECLPETRYDQYSQGSEKQQSTNDHSNDGYCCLEHTSSGAALRLLRRSRREGWDG